jgi:hypothetical protein
MRDIIESIDDRIDSLEQLERTGESDADSHRELGGLIKMRRIAGAADNLEKNFKERNMNYMHVETGSVDTRDGWIASYDPEELDERELSAEEAFDTDLGVTLLEVTPQ